MRALEISNRLESLDRPRPTATNRGHIARVVWGLVSTLVLAAACGSADETPVDSLRSEAVVQDYVFSGCTTSVVMGLSIQIADEVNCMMPGAFVTFQEGGDVDFTGSAVLPYLAAEAKDDLLAAVAAHGGTLQVNSAYRTVAQQYLLYRWWQEGRCGITAAASPGNSNHETGRALDVNNYSSYLSAMTNHGWSHSVPGDPVHFDHLGSPDLRGADVHAFQRLWSRNHPNDPIAEDGDYGPQTAARLAQSPADGFPIGACPSQPEGPAWDARPGAREVPTEATSGDRLVVWIEFENTGTSAWTIESTRLGTLAPMDHDSVFYDAENWLSPSRPTGVDHDTAPGATGRFSFVLRVPEVAEDTVVSETFGVVEEGVTWFGPSDLTIELLVHPRAGGGGPTGPFDEVEPDGSASGIAGGCSTSPASGGDRAAGVLVLLAFALVLRSRRSR